MTTLFCDHPSSSRIEITILGPSRIDLSHPKEIFADLVTRVDRPQPEEISSIEAEPVRGGTRYILTLNRRACPVRFTAGMSTRCPICNTTHGD